MAYIVIRLLILSFLLTLCSACNFVGEQLIQHEVMDEHSVIFNTWSSLEDNDLLKFKKNSELNYSFEYQSNGYEWKGTFTFAKKEEKFLLSIDLSSLENDNVKVFEEANPLYQIIGGFIDGDKLHLIPIQPGEKSSNSQIFAESHETHSGCKNQNLKSNKSSFCSMLKSNSKVFILKERNDQILNILDNFEILFPQSEAVIFKLEN